jgi:flagellar M-ring protein FliF
MAAQELATRQAATSGQDAAVTGLNVIEQVPGLRQLLLLVGIAAAVAVGVVVALWSSGDANYGVLYGNLPDRDAAQVVQALEASSIPYRYEAGRGTIMVPNDRLHEARLQLASQDLPAASGTGFEMLNETRGLTDSQFMESARYQRALEVELQRTIASISSVRGARVHLAMPRSSVFLRDRRPASASVFVQLHPGRRLESGQVMAVVNLVASSVPDMERSQVAVIDQQGTLLSSQLNEREDELNGNLEHVQRIEDRLSRRIEELLTPVVGFGRVRAQVAADLQLARTEETQERYDPEHQVIRSEQGNERRRDDNDLATGIPGALSNQPPAVTDPVADVEGGNARRDITSRQYLRNYEVDRTIRHILSPAGEIRRLSVAVVVDERRVSGDDGQVRMESYSPEELDRMTDLVQRAVGFDEGRGDTVSVINAAFQEVDMGDDMTVDTDSPLDRIDLMGLARIAGGVVVLLLLIMAVIRPLLRQLVQVPASQALLRQPQASLAYMGENDLHADDRDIVSQDPRQRYEERIAAAKSVVSQDPKRVAQVVKQWVNEDG